MYKKYLLILTAVIFCTFITANNAYAKIKLNPSLGPYMTDQGSTTPKPNQTFGWNELPNAFIQFDTDNLNTNRPLWIGWIWRPQGEPPVSCEIERITNFSEDPLNFWNSPDNWDSHKEVGEWNVRVGWFNPGGGAGTRKVNFTVTPEPISSVLFLFGGVTLALSVYRKKVKKLTKKGV